MKRRIQLLLTGEPDPLAQPEYRYYIGVDLGMQSPSVAVVGHVEEKVFHVDRWHRWEGWYFDDHERELRTLLDAYAVARGWVDEFNSTAVCQSLNLTQFKGTRQTIATVHRVSRRLINHGRVSRTSPPIAGKPPDYFATLLETLRHTGAGEFAGKDDEADDYVTALGLVLWGAAYFEQDWIGRQQFAAIQAE